MMRVSQVEKLARPANRASCSQAFTQALCKASSALAG